MSSFIELIIGFAYFNKQYVLFFTEFVVISFLIYKLVCKINKSSIKNWSIRQYFIAVLIFIIIQAIALTVLDKFQHIIVSKNTTELIQEKEYDFSKAEVVINDSETGKWNFIAEGNKIIWTEQTKEYPPDLENVWEVMLFEFNSEENKGVTTQVSNFDSAKDKSPFGYGKATGLFDGKVYWLQDYKLYTYDPESKDKKINLLAKDIQSIYGKYQNRLLVMKGNGIRTQQGLYLLNLDSNELSEFTKIGFLDNTNQRFVLSIKMNKQYICYQTKDNEIGMYNLESGENTEANLNGLFISLNMSILDCQKDYIVYANSNKSVPGTPSGLKYQIYQISESKIILDKEINRGISNSAKAKLKDNILYYSNTKGGSGTEPLIAFNLKTGTEKTILENVGDWSVSGNYLIYGKGDKKYNLSKKLFLQKL